MSKPTEGPWISYGGGKRRWAVGRAGGGHCICEMTRRDGGEDKANARLIAASPDLLAALERLLRANEADYEHLPDMDVRTAFETNSIAIKQARAAISKAKGAQQ